MVSFWGTGTSLAGHGSLRFNESVELIDPDGTISVGLMNPGGGFWDAAEYEGIYDDDADLSLHLSDNSVPDDDTAFFDALQDHLLENEISFDNDEGGGDYFESAG